MTSILGKETLTVEQCKQYLLKNNPNAPEVIASYKKFGNILGIKWGYAVAQMMKETNYLKFGGDVKPQQNNFAGIGAVGGGAVGASFSSIDDGVLAHLEHLFAYASTAPLPEGLSMLDPRFNLVKRGSCPNVEDLNGHWAVPGVGYGESIISIYNRISAEVIVVDGEERLEIAVLLYTKEDYWSGSDVAAKNGNCAMFVRPADHSVPNDAMIAKKLIVIGGPTTNHANEVLLSGKTKYDTAAAVAKYLG
jgi:N-acetylmuramoyl-L-alanine amidase